MRRSLVTILMLLGIVIFATACGSSSDDTIDADIADDHEDDEHMDEDEHMDGDEPMEDDMAHMHVEAPDEFADLSNPLADDSDALSAGQEIFEINCATCHGPEGAGDGPGSVGLDPKPANLGDRDMMLDLSDGYLFWRVSKGGAIEPFSSVMPAWEAGLTEEQRWQVISYVRTFSEQ